MVTLKSSRCAYEFKLILDLIGVKTQILIAKISGDARGEALMIFQNRFILNDREVLIYTYTLKIAGHNMHNHYYTVLELVTQERANMTLQ